MSERIHGLAQSLLGKRSIDECSLEDIQNIVDKYPYFAPAQFLLLEKLQRAGGTSYTKQLSKAVLYYHNPVEFEQFLSSGRFWINNDEADLTTLSEIPEAENTRSATPAEDRKMEEPSMPLYDNEAGMDKELPADTEAAYLQMTEPDAGNETSSTPPETEPGIDLTPVSAGSLNEVYPPVNEPVIHTQAENGESATIAGKANKEEEQTMEATGPQSTASAEISPSFTINLPSPEKEPGEATTAFVFEPYHTVDYFASQGIRANIDDAPKDKFGKQVKSFTEWLKTMKKIQANEPPRRVDSQMETKVVSMASQSVNDSEIMTEAMAEVWLKQGNKQKALEIYNKLVLLDPSKKAFFAGKIENLKNLS
jgi:hypothetical protein